jgi:hypothetical protein
VISPRDDHEVQHQLAEWQRLDDEAGRAAATRRHHMLQTSGRPVDEYAFPEIPNDWVHRDWMRPFRFVYRNIPKGFRLQLKKRLVK